MMYIFFKIIRNIRASLIYWCQAQKGVIAVLTVVLVLAIMMIILTALEFSTVIQQKIYRNTVKAVQSYYIAESGIEDALWRVKKDPSLVKEYSLNVGGGTANIIIGETIGDSKTITSGGNLLNVIRKIKVVYKIKQGNSFYSFNFGVQAGNYGLFGADPGLYIADGGQIRGYEGPVNVYSGSDAEGQGGNTYNIIGNITIPPAYGYESITKLKITGDAIALFCDNSTIDGILSCVSNNLCKPCSPWTTPEPKPFPISDEQITNWKYEARAGGEVNGGTYSGSLGPKQINGDLTVSNNNTLNVTGVIYVTSNINFGGGALIQLDPSYGSNSGMIIADGTITIGNGATLKGSGNPDSYILLISTNNPSPPPAPDAISVGDATSAGNAIFYTPNHGLDTGYGGRIVINQNAMVGQVTGRGIKIGNNATVEYKNGLANQFFTTDPVGASGVQSWEEVE